MRFVRWPTRVKQNFLFQNKTFFFKTKFSFFQNKTFFFKTKFSFFQNKTFFFKTKFSFSKQNFLFQNKTFAYEQRKLFYETKIYFAKLSFAKQNFLFKTTLVSLVSSKQMRTEYWSAILRLLWNWCCHVLRVLWNIHRRELRSLPRMWCGTWSRKSDHHELFWKGLSLPENEFYPIRTQFLKVSSCNFELTARRYSIHSPACATSSDSLQDWDLVARGPWTGNL